MSEVFFIKQASPSRKKEFKDTVKISEIKEIRFFVRGKAKVILKNGELATVSAQLADAFCDKHHIWNMPKGYTDKDIDFSVTADQIQNILFRYQRVSRVRLLNNRETFVPRSVSDLFQATASDFISRNVDQPWNDRRIFDVPLSDIVKIIRISKHSARVLTVDMVKRLVSVERARAFLSSNALEGEEELAKYGISIVREAKGAKRPKAKSSQEKPARVPATKVKKVATPKSAQKKTASRKRTKS